MVISAENKVLGLATKIGILRPRDLQKQEASTRLPLATSLKDKLVKVWKGNVRHSQLQSYRTPTLIRAAQRVQHGVVCLLSALRFHDLTTQSPFEVWMAINSRMKGLLISGM